ncbi:MAG: cell surface protein SprA [Bacteroidota bacterium]
MPASPSEPIAAPPGRAAAERERTERRGAVSPAIRRARWWTLAASVCTLTSLMAAAAWQASTAAGMRSPSVWRYVAAADTDSVAVQPADTANLPPFDPADVESLRVAAIGDTTTLDTTRAATYFPRRQRDSRTAAVVERRDRPFDFAPGSYWRREAELDSVDLRYSVREIVRDEDVRVPVELGLEEFQATLRASVVRENFRSLAQEQLRRRGRGRGGLGLTIAVPGGRGGAFETIFGKNEVALNVTGNANINLGFSYQENEQQQAATGQGGRLNPDFAQELALGIDGTIGDKLNIGVNYDTQNTFEFENQVKLLYEGYDDDIIQRIEAGNVFLQTPSDLIRGGQRLFGIRTDLRFGGLGVTLVASQQDAEGDALEIEGGSQTTNFDISPFDYEDNAHFFLSYYFRNRWDLALSRPPTIIADANFDQIVGIDVWLKDRTVNQTNQLTEGLAQAVALVDLGEPGPGPQFTIDNLPDGVLAGGDAYLAALGATAPLPDETIDQYEDADLEQLRDSSNTIDFEGRFGLDIADYADTRFRKLTEGRDYAFDPQLGYLSLNRSLSPDEQIAIAFQYRRADGSIVEVGDFNEETGADLNGRRIILKLLRGDNPTAFDASWALTMRNIYRIGGRSLRADDLELDIVYAPSGQPAQETLPGVTVGQQRTLLTTLGLDRLDNDGSTPQPNAQFDFVNGLTINAGNGRVVFPYLEPFGARLREVFEGNGTLNGEDLVVQFTGEADIVDAASATNAYVFDTLYTSKQETASRFPGLDRYAIVGSFRSSVQESYSLGFAVVEGSVRVTSGGVALNEGTDYQVDYATGEVLIINQAYLTAGQNISIDYERNQFAAIGRKTLLGLRADYTLGEDLDLGATWMRLSERPLIDKYRIGEEPIDNTIFGFDGRFAAEPRWLTRFADALPLVQTKAPSSFEIKGEYARFQPGHPETFAFESSREELQSSGRDFNADELQGISFIDDFEGTENSFSLTQAGAWRLAAGPVGAGPAASVTNLGSLDVTSPTLVSNWRGLTSWYTLQQFLYSANGLVSRLGATPATRQVRLQEIFADRQEIAGQPNIATPLDLYIDPARRGPYNYNLELGSSFEAAPEDVWGGIVQRLPEGYNDFDGRNNIEFVEFILAPYGGRDGTAEVSDGAVLYVDLGQLSEDVLPDGRFNTEDGLVETDAEGASLSPYGRLATGSASGSVDLDDAALQTEDLGLDGLRSASDLDGGVPYALSEQTFENFQPFLNALGDANPLDRALAQVDPSGDDFVYFEDDTFYGDPAFFESGNATVQERFSRFFAATELNAFESQQQLGGGQGNSTFPDDEDIDRDLGLDRAESFYRYAVPIGPNVINVPCEFEGQQDCNPYFINRVGNEGNEEWTLIRIPVRSGTGRTAVGNIEDFSRIEALRVWTDGHQVPATLRFATFDLVGSQWLKSDLVGLGDERQPIRAGGASAGLEPQLFVATVNNEENRNQYLIPNGALISRTQDAQGQFILQREQAIVVRAEDLGPDVSRGIFRSYSNQLDLTKYTNLRAFVHGEGFDRSEGDSLRVFLRLGTNETQDYYEIEQPVYPYEPEDAGGALDPDSLWQTNVFVDGESIDRNSINVVLSALNQLKVERNNAPDAVPSQRYAGGVPPPDTPDGARIFIRGNPSIESITTIVLGIRNVSGNTLNPEVWFNELRVAGYDEEPGWSAYATASLQLADLATVRGRIERQTDAFGDLSSGLGDRSFTDQQAYTVNTTFNAHKLLPERFGVQMPVNVSVQQRTSTPRFSPRRGGDIRLDDLIEQAQNDPNLSAAQQDSLVALYQEESETVSFTRTISVPFSKRGSRSPWLRYTVDGLALSYSNTQSERRSPAEQFNNSNSWSASMRYSLRPPGVKTIRPFWLLDGAPLLGLLARLQLNLLPSSVSFNADASRTVAENQQRAPIAVNEEVAAVPERYRNAIRENHTFTHRRSFDLAYSPFNFLALTYGSNLNQVLSAIGADRTNDTFVIDSTGAPVGEFIGQTPDEAAFEIDPTFTADSLTANSFRVFTTERLDVIPVFGVVGDVFSGQRDIQTDTYTQNFGATLTPRLQGVRWIRPQSISYSSGFQWTFQPLSGLEDTAPDLRLASISNTLNLRTGLTLSPRDLLREFGFYRRLEDAEETYQNDRRRRRPARVAARDRLAEAEEEAEEQGVELTEEERAALEVPERVGPPSPVSIARQLFLAVTGISDLTTTYNSGRTTRSGAVDGSAYNLFDAITGEGPSLAYRLGLEERPQRTIFDPAVVGNLQVDDIVGRNNDLQTRTSLELSRNLRVDLNWSLGWDRSTTFSFIPTEAGDSVDEAPPIESGGGSATVWALGGSYERFLTTHVDRYQADIDAGRVTEDGVAFTSALSNNGLAEDFRSAFTSSFGSFGPNNFFALPLPNWTVTYNGLGNWPLFRLLATQVTVRHGYSATYDLDYRSDALAFAEGGSFENETINGTAFQVPVDARQSQNVRLNERFQPLIGFNMTLRGGIQADVSFTQSKALSLSVAGANVSESTTDEVSVRLSFSKTGLRIPLPFVNRRRINNNVRMSLTFSTANNSDQRLNFRQDFLDTISGGSLSPQTPEASTRITLEPRISYTISSQVTADVFVRYTSLESEGSRIPSTSTLNGGFNFRVSFSGN